MEPEIVTAIIDNKFTIIGIGFYFGMNGQDFEVFTPKGNWRGHATPKNLWLLAKVNALCADS